MIFRKRGDTCVCGKLPADQQDVFDCAVCDRRLCPACGTPHYQSQHPSVKAIFASGEGGMVTPGGKAVQFSKTDLKVAAAARSECLAYLATTDGQAILLVTTGGPYDFPKVEVVEDPVGRGVTLGSPVNITMFPGGIVRRNDPHPDPHQQISSDASRVQHKGDRCPGCGTDLSLDSKESATSHVFECARYLMPPNHQCSDPAAVEEARRMGQDSMRESMIDVFEMLLIKRIPLRSVEDLVADKPYVVPPEAKWAEDVMDELRNRLPHNQALRETARRERAERLAEIIERERADREEAHRPARREEEDV